MAETREDLAPEDDEEALKRRLIRRIAVAGVLIVALLGGLAVFDALNEPSEPEKTAALPPADAVPKAEDKTEEKPAEPAADKDAEAEKAAKAEEKPAEAPAERSEPERTVTPMTPAAKPPRPLTPPARARAATIRPSEPVTRHAPPSRPLTQAGGEPQRMFVLQMGVFNNMANAEDLRAKLEEGGIPSQIEARVQVGPFRTRQEVETMREKLRAMGMETGLLLAIRK